MKHTLLSLFFILGSISLSAQNYEEITKEIDGILSEIDEGMNCDDALSKLNEAKRKLNNPISNKTLRNIPDAVKVKYMLEFAKRYEKLGDHDDVKTSLNYIIDNKNHRFLSENDRYDSQRLAMSIAPYCLRIGEYTLCAKYCHYAIYGNDNDDNKYRELKRNMAIRSDVHKDEVIIHKFNTIVDYFKEKLQNSLLGPESHRLRADSTRNIANTMTDLTLSVVLDIYSDTTRYRGHCQNCYKSCLNAIIYLRQFAFRQAKNSHVDIKHSLDFNFVRDIADSLKEDEIAVEICPRRGAAGTSIDTLEYIAFIIDNNKHIDVSYVCRESHIKSLLKKTEKEPWTLYTSEKDSLERIVWSSIKPYTQGKKHVYVTPSGILNRINFSILDDRIVELTSSYEVCKRYEPSSSKKIVLVGDIKDRELSYSEDEINSIDSILKPFLPNIEKITKDSTEAKVHRSLSDSDNVPLWLHFATHADIPLTHAKFEKDFSYMKKTNARKTKLYYSALILSGEGASQDSNPHNDGHLFASEIAEYDLNGTEMVVLSTCSSATGIYDDYEGCLGLVKAFKYAGAHTIIASLWPAYDAASYKFMKIFYRKMTKKQSLCEAFNETVKEIRDEDKDPKYWAAFKIIDYIDR